MLFGSLKGINDGEEDVEVPNVVLELVVVLFGSLKGIRELLLLLTVELTVGLLELFELVTVGVTVDVVGLLDTDGKSLKNMTRIKGSGQIGPPENWAPHFPGKCKM